MANSIRPSHILPFKLFLHPTTALPPLFPPLKFRFLTKHFPLKLSPPTSTTPFSTTATPYPLQYDMIISRPAHSSRPHPRPRLPPPSESKPADPELDSEIGFDDWVDRKLSYGSPSSGTPADPPSVRDNDNLEMDKSMRKYYNKRRKRMYGSDSEDERNRRDEDKFVELKQEVVELRTLHKKEEELYFYDTFAFPWEKEKHYKMVYQMEKKYFPDQCFDKAFLEPGESNETVKKGNKRPVKGGDKTEKAVDGGNDKGLVFFEDEGEKDVGLAKDARLNVSERKVEEFFKYLKKVPSKEAEVACAEPFVATRSNGLPPKWDSPAGTVVLVNKPKGSYSH